MYAMLVFALCSLWQVSVTVTVTVTVAVTVSCSLSAAAQLRNQRIDVQTPSGLRQC